jgi:hypothetical protein
MTHYINDSAAWQQSIVQATRELSFDFGNLQLTDTDLLFEIAITSNVLSGHSEKANAVLEESYVDNCLSYMLRSFAITQQAFPNGTKTYQAIWQHLVLAHSYILRRQTALAILELDGATLDVAVLTGKSIMGAYGTIDTVRFMLRKFEERLACETFSETARLFELDGILVGACNSCIQIGIDYKVLGSELVPLFEDFHHHRVPEPERVEALALVLNHPPIN